MVTVLHVRVPDKITEKIDQLVKQGHYSSRSDFVRVAIRKLLAS